MEGIHDDTVSQKIRKEKEGKRREGGGGGGEKQGEFLGAVNEREEYERSTTGLWSAGTGVEEIEVDGGKARGRRRLPVMTRETCERRHGMCMYVDAGNVRNSYVKRWFEVSGSLIQTSRGHSVADINGF